MSESRPLLPATTDDATKAANVDIITHTPTHGSNDNGKGRVQTAITPPNSHFARPRSRSLPIITRDPPRKRWWQFFGSARATIYSIGLLATGVGNAVWFKQMTNHAPNYPFYLSQVINIVYIPIFFGLVEYERRYTQLITMDMQQFPKRNFFYMGTADALAGLLMLFGGVGTAGSTQALLGNAVIPVTMFLATIMLSTYFSKLEYMGAAIIFGGVTIALLPSFIDDTTRSGDKVLFNLIYLASSLPAAFSSVYKEVALRNIEMDCNYLQAWVAFYQLIIGALLIPVNTLPFLGANTIPWSNLGDTLIGGFNCMIGVNSIVTNCIDANGNVIGDITLIHDGISLPVCDACEGSWWPLLVYLLFNISQSVFVVLVIKHGSASLMYLISTLRLPMVQVAFTLAWINYPPDTFHWASLLGLFVVLAGLVIYRWPRPTHRRRQVRSISLAVGTNGKTSLDEFIEETETINIFGGGGSGSGQIDLTVALQPLAPPHSPQTHDPHYHHDDI